MGDKAKEVTRKEFLKLSAGGIGAVGVGILAAKSTEAKGAANKRPARWVMVIDLDRCIGCQACAIACKTEFYTRLGVFRSQVNTREYGQYPAAKRDFLPWMCNHCGNPPCVKVCPVDPIEAEFKGMKFEKRATYKRPDGVVLVDQDRCIGCGMCIMNCPYRVRSFDPGKKAGGNPDLNPADKCTLCEHRLEAGVVPSCVNTCQARARIVGNMDDPASEVAKLLKGRKAQVLLPAKGTKPQVFYLGRSNVGINDSLDKGDDLRTEANSEYQLQIWQDGPYAG